MQLILLLVIIMNRNIIIVMNKFIKKCVCDDNGKIAIAQFPNLPIIFALVFTLLSFLQNLNNSLENLFSFLASGFIFVWAYLELFQGVNYFRRLLGLVVLIFLIYGALK